MPDIVLGPGGHKSGGGELRHHPGFAVAMQADPRAQLPVVRQCGADQPDQGILQKALGLREVQQGDHVPGHADLGTQNIPQNQAAAGFQKPPDYRECGIQFARRHVLGDRIHDGEIDRAFLHLPHVIQRSHPDFHVRSKTCDQPAAYARCRLRQKQLAAGLRHPGCRQRFAAGIIEHHGVRRGDVAGYILGDDLEMQVAMQLARVDRMGGIVIVDPVVHR